jgi:hypothetical protein
LSNAHYREKIELLERMNYDCAASNKKKFSIQSSKKNVFKKLPQQEGKFS